jgi:pyruvate formate lyase activating enzyme
MHRTGDNIADQGIAVGYAQPLADGRLLCTVCPRACKLADGQRGLCFVRANSGGQMRLTTYGRSSGFCIDPIEKKPLAHFLPGTSVLSFGTAGCNLACAFCQNHDISKSRDFDTLQSAASPEAIAKAARDHGCASIAFTYNDPVIFLEYAIDCAKAAHAVGLKTVAVTAGYMLAQPRRDFFTHIDAANVDLKAFSERFYRDVTKGRLADVLETLTYLVHETSVWTEITTLLIPGENDSDAELDALTRWIASDLGPHIPLHFSAFHPDFKMLDTPGTPHATLARARQIARSNGLEHVYIGNLTDPGRQSSLCATCGSPVISRDWHEIINYALDSKGACAHCGTPFPGHFADKPGAWGRKRQRISIG